MNEALNKDTVSKNIESSVKKQILSWIFRICGAMFWCFLYISFVWYLDYRNIIEKLMGFASLGIGLAAILLPRKAFGEKYWFYAMYIFLRLGVFLMILMN